MAKGYWVALVDVDDPEGYKAYVAANAVAFRKYGAGLSCAAADPSPSKDSPGRAWW